MTEFKDIVQKYDEDNEDLDIIHKLTHVRIGVTMPKDILEFVADDVISTEELARLMKYIQYYYRNFEENKDIELSNLSRSLFEKWKYTFEKESLAYIKKIVGGRQGADTKYAKTMRKQDIEDYFYKVVNLKATYGEDKMSEARIEADVDKINSKKDKLGIYTEEELQKHLEELEQKGKITLKKSNFESIEK